MSKHTDSRNITLILILATLPVLAACRPMSSAGATGFDDHRATAATGFDDHRATAAMVHRWALMGQAYEELTQGKISSPPFDVAAGRWQAMGEAYRHLAAANVASAADASVARWQALGQAYERQFLLGIGDVSTARWQAMGQAYEKSGATDNWRPALSK